MGRFNNPIDPQHPGLEPLQTPKGYKTIKHGRRIVTFDPTVPPFGVDIKTREAQEKVEGGLIRLFKGVGEVIKASAIAFVTGTVSAALLPFLGPVGSAVFVAGMGAAVKQIQTNLKPLELGLRDDTIQKLAGPLQGKVLDDSTLPKTIEDVLSKDRQANEDLAKAFTKLLPIIKKAAAATNTEFSGPVQRLTISDPRTIFETFNGFLQEGL